MKKDSIYQSDLQELYRAGQKYRKEDMGEHEYLFVLKMVACNICSVEERKLEESLSDFKYEIENIMHQFDEEFMDENYIRDGVLAIVQKIEDLIGSFPELPEDPYTWPFEDYR